MSYQLIATTDRLSKISDPFARASEYGRITGKCAACGRKLEDPDSRRNSEFEISRFCRVTIELLKDN